MRVLWIGDLAATGFGSVTMDLGRRMIDQGLDVRFISQNDAPGEMPEPFASQTVSVRSMDMAWDTITGNSNAVGPSNVIGSLIDGTTKAKLVNGQEWDGWKPDAAVLLGDFFAARAIVGRAPEEFGSIPTYHYVPVEGIDLPPTLAHDLWAYTRPVAMSNFGATEIERVVGYRPPMIYHGVDTEVFHPVAGPDSRNGKPIYLKGANVTLTSRKACKDFWSQWFRTKLPAKMVDGKMTHTAKWMLRTDRHMPRKRYNSMLRSLAPVLLENPDAILIIHCASTDFGGSLGDSISKLPGVNPIVVHGKPYLPESWGVADREYAQVILTNGNGMGRAELCSLYNAADLYVSTSAEGFGLTIAEALACGTPSVGLDYSAVPEVIGPAGQLLPVAYLYDNEYDHLWAAAHEAKSAEIIHALLNDPTLRETLGRRGPKHVRSTFSWDAAAAQFADLIRGNVWPPSQPSEKSEPISEAQPTPPSSPPASLAAISS